MGKVIAGLASAAFLSAITVFSITSSQAKTVRECNDEYAANKPSIQASGQKKKDFVTACRAGGQAAPSGSIAAPSTSPPPTVAPRPVSPSAQSANVKTVRQCDEEYAANKPAIQGSGQKKKDFITACRAGAETIPAGAASPAAPLSPTAAPRTAAPASPTPTVTAPAPTPSVATPSPLPPSTAPQRSAVPNRTGPSTAGTNQFTTDAQAKASCPGDTVVWVNTRSGVYHYAGFHNYGTTKSGTYMCETAATAAGNRAPKNEQHP